MGWYKQHSTFKDNPFNRPVIDRCINCGHDKQVKTTITMEFGEGNYNSGPICVKCYSSYVFNKITYQEF